MATHPNFISRYSDHDGRRFQTNKERLACGCRKGGRLFHTVSSGTGTEPHSASAWLPRGTSATKIRTYQSRKVYFKDLLFAPSFQQPRSLLTYSQVSPKIDFTLKSTIPSCIFAFHFFDHFKSVLECHNFKFPLPFY